MLSPSFLFGGAQSIGPSSIPSKPHYRLSSLPNATTSWEFPETTGQKLRRLARDAAKVNPYLKSPMYAPLPWTPGAAYNVQQVYANAGNIYVAGANGTAASANVGGPTSQTVSGITDNNYTAQYVGPNNYTVDPSMTIVPWFAGMSASAGSWTSGVFTAPTFCSKSGNIYFATQSGIASVSGPAGTGVAIADGGILWNYYGPLQSVPVIEDFPIYTIQTSTPSGLTNPYFANAIPNAIGALGAFPIAGGSGYTVGDNVTLTGGTFTQAVTLRVTSVSGSAITAVTVLTAGSYTILPTPTVAQGSTTGGGSGATFALRWPDPYWCKIRGGYWTGTASGNQISIVTFTPTLNCAPTPNHASIEFETDALRLDVFTTTTSSPLAMFIDGVPLSRQGIYSSSTSSLHHVLDFTSSGRGRKYRTIRVEGRFQINLGAIRVDPSATVRAPSDVDKVTAVTIVDSLFAGSQYGPFVPGNTVAQRLGHELGWNNVWDYSEGGTGYINRGTGPGTTSDIYGFRVPEALTLNPDIWVLMGSTNDSGNTASAIAAAQLTLIQAIRAGSAAPIVVFGIWSLDDTAYASGKKIADYETAMASSIAAYNDPLVTFIPLRNAPEGPIITGSWNNSFNTNSTNSTIYISGDATHPPDPGTTYLARVLANKIRTFLLGCP